MKEETQKDEPKESIDKDLFLKALGIIVRTWRRKAELEISQLAEKAKVLEAIIQALEYGKVYDVRIVSTVADIMEIKLSSLIARAERLEAKLRKRGTTVKVLDMRMKLVDDMEKGLKEFGPMQE